MHESCMGNLFKHTDKMATAMALKKDAEEAVISLCNMKPCVLFLVAQL